MSEVTSILAARQRLAKATAAAAQAAIDLLDILGGDPDLDTTNAEDEALTGPALRLVDGPGCIIADPDAAVDDNRCDAEVDL